MKKRIQILLVGETWFTFKMDIKGFDVFQSGGYENLSVDLINALKEFEDIEISHLPNHLVAASFPNTIGELNKFDIVVFSDCGKNNILFYPDMCKVPMGPNRLELIKEFVSEGKSFLMCGGWNSFQGLLGIPGYHDSIIEQILPVNIKSSDDRIEKPEGISPKEVC